MKILVVGTGTIGAAVVEALRGRHDVVGVSRHSRPALDIEQPESVRQFFSTARGFDAVVSCAGGAAFRPFAELTDDEFAYSIKSKLMGQVAVTRAALPVLNDGGSITLTSGVLAQSPMPGSGAVSLVNAALEGFGRAAALEAPRGIRVNVVSPPWVKETMAKLKMDPSSGMSAAEVAKAYVAVVEGNQRGQTIDPRAL